MAKFWLTCNLFICQGDNKSKDKSVRLFGRLSWKKRPSTTVSVYCTAYMQCFVFHTLVPGLTKASFINRILLRSYHRHFTFLQVCDLRWSWNLWRLLLQRVHHPRERSGRLSQDCQPGVLQNRSLLRAEKIRIQKEVALTRLKEKSCSISPTSYFYRLLYYYCMCCAFCDSPLCNTELKYQTV